MVLPMQLRCFWCRQAWGQLERSALGSGLSQTGIHLILHQMLTYVEALMNSVLPVYVSVCWSFLERLHAVCFLHHVVDSCTMQSWDKNSGSRTTGQPFWPCRVGSRISMYMCFCCIRFGFFSTGDWLGRMSPKWPILYRMGRKANQSQTRIVWSGFWVLTYGRLLQCSVRRE